DPTPMMKRLALHLAFRAGVFRTTQIALGRGQASILTFHRFTGDGQGHRRGLPVRRLEGGLRYLPPRYLVLSLLELCGELRRGVVPPHPVAITIDDGYHGVASLVAPLLRRYDAPATFFVVSDLVDGRLWLWTDKFRFVFDHAPAGLIHVKTGAGVQ